MIKYSKCLCLSLVVLFSTSSPAFAADASNNSTSTTTEANVFDKVFATVNGQTISQAEYQEYLYQEGRERFYHGKPAEGEGLAFARESGDKLIDITLAAKEAKALSLPVDEQKISATVDAYDEKFNASEQWQQVRNNVLPVYKSLAEKKLLAKAYYQHIEQSVKLSKTQLENYHRENIDKFTQPAQNHIAVIMLNVQPSATSFVWQAALDQAKNIHEKLKQDGDFAELAQLHSTDVTADQGGDMGFLHQGMTAASVESALAKLNVGEFTEPLMLLDGIAIFKIIARKPPIVHSFSEVEARATRLAYIDTKESAIAAEKERLKSTVKIDVNENTFDQ